MLIERFLKWMVGADASQRADAASLLARLYGDARLMEMDREAVEAGLTYLLDDPDLSVRQALALAVCDEGGLPHHMPLALAHDVPEVAAIVVARSGQLGDGELVDLIATQGEFVQRAAAARLTVSPALAAALAEVGSLSAVVELLLNPGAKLADFSLLRVLERFGDEGFLRQILAGHERLPVVVRQMVMRLDLAENAGILPHEIHEDHEAAARLREAIDKATLDLVPGAGPGEIAALVAHLRRTGQLTTALILRAMVLGERGFVAESLANLSGMALDKVYAVLDRGDATVVRALVRRSGLPDRALPAFLAALDVTREMIHLHCAASYAQSRRIADRIIEKYCESQGDHLDDLVATLRRYASEAARDAARRFVEQSVVHSTLPALTFEVAAPMIGYGAEEADSFAQEYGTEDFVEWDRETIEEQVFAAEALEDLVGDAVLRERLAVGIQEMVDLSPDGVPLSNDEILARMRSYSEYDMANVPARAMIWPDRDRAGEPGIRSAA